MHTVLLTTALLRTQLAHETLFGNPGGAAIHLHSVEAFAGEWQSAYKTQLCRCIRLQKAPLSLRGRPSASADLICCACQLVNPGIDLVLEALPLQQAFMPSI